MTGVLMGWGLFDFKEQFLVMFFLKTKASALVKVFQWQVSRGGNTASRATETNSNFFFSRQCFCLSKRWGGEGSMFTLSGKDCFSYLEQRQDNLG